VPQDKPVVVNTSKPTREIVGDTALYWRFFITPATRKWATLQISKSKYVQNHKR
jgi:hypothetical protein